MELSPAAYSVLGEDLREKSPDTGMKPTGWTAAFSKYTSELLRV